ncbi:MAG: glycosyltransferase family 2 protein [Bacteroidetes bacterium]|nr:glycosyltransferase family 2 protein [Bacteroidota bacterium]
MKSSLIICTYQRPQALKKLLDSLALQTLLPSETLIIDGSLNDLTKQLLEQQTYDFKITYVKANDSQRGLTKQRNLGISMIDQSSEIVCFLDDDTVLQPNYFEELINTYQKYPKAIAVGGYIRDGVWKPSNGKLTNLQEFEMDGFTRHLGARNVLRKRLGLLSNLQPGYMPEFGNGLSIGFLPPSKKIYSVEFFMGGVSSYRKKVFEKHHFSEYFEGYGLYEDMDFCLRIGAEGELYVNTAAQLYHEHEESGRPNAYRYGKMVVRNGWYVWRLRYPNPTFNAKLKWHCIMLLLLLIRLTNAFTGPNRIQAFKETIGRKTGWLSLWLSKPKIQ